MIRLIGKQFYKHNNGHHITSELEFVRDYKRSIELRQDILMTKSENREPYWIAKKLNHYVNYANKAKSGEDINMKNILDESNGKRLKTSLNVIRN